ncbi:MAG TPA: flagellar basal-body rod protein FlgF [Steroidobacter sp.]|uniref:flagellar basal-body rod protein FlgF n=1 Tax=Steroidobacter sp. TaxID=1978227 RepID=UPI002EDB8759
MDALIYTLMSGAERSMRAQRIHANNLANLETGGFRADLELATSQPVDTGYGYDSRHMSQLQANSVSSREGVLRQTGQDLDVAISGQGFFTVQFGEGEAYTRAGHFMVDQDGQLTLDGRPVLGDGGPIVLPQFSRVQVASDGVISIQAPGQVETQQVDRLRLVKPDPAAVTKNSAGLLVSRSGEPFAADETVTVRSGHLEGSNVSAVEEMIAVMSLTREFEIQMKLYRAADAMAEGGNRLVGG